LNKAIAPSADLRRFLPGLAALAILLLTVAIYAPGLHGPFLLDDIGNLEPLDRWMKGSLNWHAVVFDNRSGPTGRPLSMATFLLDVLRTGQLNSFSFKPTNLVIHLISGLLVLALASEVFRAVGWPEKRRQWSAVALMTTWLWLPIQVSTVLYIIQRMAQLSAMWMLATVALYLFARRILVQRTSIGRMALLWIGVPALALLALLSKENGALALPLAAVAEWALFDRTRRPRSILVFLGVTVVVPTLCVIAYILVHPGFFTRGYAVRDFTLGQRLLTEPRIMWDYLQTSVLPVGSRMGIYHDNYVISTSLWQPWTTALSIFAWLALLVWAMLWRRHAPVFALGVVAYLAAHVIESGPIALELYFEHRNYLPSVFALIAIVGLLNDFLSRRSSTIAFARTGTAAAMAVILIYGLSSLNHAFAWSSEAEFHALQYGYNPSSPRLLSVLAGKAMIRKDLAASLHFIDEGERYAHPSERSTATLWRIMAYCEAGSAVPDSIYTELEGRNRGRLTNFAMTAWELLANRTVDGCTSLDTMRVAHDGLAWLEQSGQPAGVQLVWRTRYNIGRMIATTGDLAGAEAEVHRAWTDSGRNNGIGVMLFQLNASLGRIEVCKEVLASLERSSHGDDYALNRAVRSFTEAMPGLEAGASR
jgi:hypothetical protein